MDQKLQAEIFNSAYPVIGVELFRGGLVVRRGGANDTKPLRPPPKRGKVSYLSRRSLSNLAFLAHTTSVTFLSLMTLTYGLEYPTCGKLLKRHLNSLLVQSRRKFGYHDYLWFLEFQRRGAPHVHILTTLAPPTARERFEWASLWVRIVLGRGERDYCVLATRKERSLLDDMLAVHQHPRSWEPIRKRDGARRYVVKYATKTYQKTVPREFGDVGRFWACSRPVRVNPGEAISLHCDDDTLRRMLFLVGREDLVKWDILPTKIMVSRETWEVVKRAQGKERGT